MISATNGFLTCGINIFYFFKLYKLLLIGMAGKIDETVNGMKPITDIPNGNNNVDAVGLAGIKIISIKYLNYS